MTFLFSRTKRSTFGKPLSCGWPQGLALIMSLSAVLALSDSALPETILQRGGNLTAQINPNPEIFNESPFNRTPRPQQPADASPPSSTDPALKPDAVMTPVQGKVSIRFVNVTGAAIDYQVIDVTEYRTLAGRSEMTLQDLDLPTTLTFRRQDKGFLLVNLEENQPQAGILTITVQETPDFAADRTSIYVDPSGGIYLN
jgi:hypothetical protein